MPDALEPLVTEILSDLSRFNSAGILSLSTIFLLWSASKGVYGLVRGLNQALRVQETRPYLLVRALCVLYTAAVLAILLITVMLYTVSQSFLSKILLPGSVLHRLLSTILHYRWFVAGVLLLIAFSVSYLVFPCRRSTLRQVLPGSLAASCGWVIFSGLFSHYVKLFGASSVHLRQHLHRRLHHALALFLHVHLLLRRSLEPVRECAKKEFLTRPDFPIAQRAASYPLAAKRRFGVIIQGFFVNDSETSSEVSLSFIVHSVAGSRLLSYRRLPESTSS